MTYELYPFQREDVRLMQGKPYFLNGNAVGMGKTVEHISEVANWAYQDDPVYSVRLPPRDFQVLVLTLKAAIPQWELWVARVCPELRGFFTITNHEQLLERYRAECEYCDEGFLTAGGMDAETDPPWRTDVKCPDCKGRGYRIKTRPNELFARTEWTFVIVDEAHRFKNRKALQTKALKKIKAQQRREATGSKLPPEELWSLLNYLDPKKYSSYWRFFEEYVDYYTDFRTVGGKTQGFKVIIGVKNEDQLRKELEGISIFKKKKQCQCAYPPMREAGRYGTTLPAEPAWSWDANAGRYAHDHLADLPDMPEPVYRVVDLEGPQKRAYAAMKKDALAWVGEHEDQPLAAPVVIAQLRRLQMLADAYMESDEVVQPWERETLGPHNMEVEGLSTDEEKALQRKYESTVHMSLPSAKLEALWDIVEGTDEPIVVFSQFRQMIELAADYLTDRDVGDATLVMHGQSPEAWKRESWQAFQRGVGRVFLTTIGAGGTGIDLYRASVCVFLDRTYSPAQNEQAEGRLYRAGQKNSVQRYYIVARDTVDDHVEEKLDFKADIVRRIFGG